VNSLTPAAEYLVIRTVCSSTISRKCHAPSPIPPIYVELSGIAEGRGFGGYNCPTF